MRVSNVLALVAVMLLGSILGGTPILGQQAASPQATRIAVIDVGFIVKNHPTIKTQQNAIRERVKAAQEELGKRRQNLITEAEKLKSFNEGTPEFNKLQEKLANEEAQLKLDTVRREKELDEEEAKMAIAFYQQLQTLISQVAEHNQIDLVLRSNREAPDLKQPATIQMALEKGVVYNRPQLDMTDLILQMIGQQAQAAPASSASTGPVMNAAAPGTAPVRR